MNDRLRELTAFVRAGETVSFSRVVRPLDAPDIRRQARFNTIPLLLAQPKQILAHIPILFQFRIRIVFSGRKN
jgi:hypothetical protein